MLEEFVNSLECVRVKKGDTSILEALENFDCGNKESCYYEVSYNMLERFKSFVSGNETFNEAYYVIRDSKDIFLFFSLQSSIVFSTCKFSPEDTSKLETVYNSSLSADTTGYRDTPETDIFKGNLEMFEGLLEKYDCKDDKNIVEFLSIVQEIVECRKIDKQNNIYVERIIPGIELVNFCKNHKVNEKWKSVSGGISMGASLFWYKILPIIKDVSQKIGCVYVTLFAADKSSKDSYEGQKLLSYYENALKLENPTELHSLKPHYDWKCMFLCQKIEKLCQEEMSFKQNFLNGLSDDDV